jgi:oligoribonuclease NrnB/cAMP/cGMP phosphodiesterase (DHH superfamily)
VKHHIIHHADADGHAAAAVVYLRLIQQKVDVSDIFYIRINYGWKLDDSRIDYDKDCVYIVDYCLQPYEQMQELYAQLGERLTWIDHHQTSLECEEEFGLEQVHGLRSTKLSGCELTWRYYFAGNNMPAILDIIGTWDTFRRTDKDKWEHEVLPVNAYLFAYDTRPHTNIGFWHNLLEKALEDPAQERIELEAILRKGRMMRKYQVSKEDSVLRQAMFKGKFAGHSALIANAGQLNSLIYERAEDSSKVDLLVGFVLVKGDHWRVNIYTTQDNVDCATLCKRLGAEGPMRSGGGHRKAAGFQTDWEHLSSYIETEDGPLFPDLKAQAESWDMESLLQHLGLVVISLRAKRDDCEGRDEALSESYRDAGDELEDIYDALKASFEVRGD